MQTKEILYAVALAALGLSVPTTGALAAPPGPGQTLTTGAATAPVSEPNVVTEVSVTPEENGTRIIIVGSRPFTPEVSSLGRPSATIITVAGKWSAGRAGYTNVRKNGVTLVRYGQFTSSQVRIVANTRRALTFQSQPSADRTRWEIVVQEPGAAARTASASAKPVAVAAPKPVALAAKPAAPAPKPVASVSTAPAATFIKPVPPAMATPTAPATDAATTAVAVTPAPKPAALVVQKATPAPAPIFATRVASSKNGPYPGLLNLPSPPVARPKLVAISPAPSASEPKRVALASPGAVSPASAAVDDAESRRVSLDFVAADINDVLKALSLQSGINIVTGNDVKGNITVSLKRVSMTEALDMVTRLSGYTYAKFGPTFVVGTPSSVGAITARSEKPVENVTEFIPYRYTSSANLYRVLGDKFPGLKLPEPEKNDLPSQPKLLVLTDSPKRVTEVRDFVEKMEQVASVPTQGAVTEVYQIKYASPADLINLLARLVPTVSSQPGPTQGFQPQEIGGSTAFSAGGTYGTPPASGAGSAGGTTGGTGGTGGNNSKHIPTTLLLTGAPADIARAKEVLTDIDIRVPQMVYEAKVIDINDADSQQLGFTYDFTRAVNIGENNNTGTAGTVGPGASAGPARQPNFGTIFRTPYSIGVALDALAKQGKSRILANPNLSALDGQPAIAFIGDQIKYVIAVQQTQQGQTIQTETATVGITLRVTGKSSPDGTITLYVHPEVSVITSYLDAGGGIQLPQIATRFVDTTIRVKDGETIGIGGLIQESDVRNLQKVPILGDLPFFGKLLFTHQSTSKTKSNVVILITARVAKD